MHYERQHYGISQRLAMVCGVMCTSVIAYEHIVCKERYAQPHPLSSIRSCPSVTITADVLSRRRANLWRHV